jgi:hypothetical protein
LRLSRVNTAQLENRARRIRYFRRRAWVPRRVRASWTPAPEVLAPEALAPEVLAPEVLVSHEYIPGEYDEPPRSAVVAGIRRGIGLASDIIILILASPFFAVWFLYRSVLRLTRSRR